MVVYLLTFLTASFSAFCASHFISKSKIIFFFFSLCTILIPSLIAGLRSETVGTDMRFYLLEIYEKAAIYSDKSQIMTDGTFEPVFLLIVFCALNLFKSLQGILFSLEFVNMSLVYTGLVLLRKKLSIGIAVAVYLFLFFNDSMNLMRQHVAVSLCFLSFACLYRKKYVFCLITYAIALFAHSTSFIFAVPIIVFESFRRGWVNMKSTIVKIYMVGLPLSLFLIDKLLSILISLGVVSEKYMRYLTTENDSGTRFPLSYFFFFILFFVIGMCIANNIPKSWNLLNLKKIIKDGDNVKLVKNFFAFDIYSVIVIGLSTLVSLWIYRMNIYFQVLLVALFPILIRRLEVKDLRYLKYLFGALLFVYWFWTFIHSNNGETYPYHSVILGI